VIDLPLIFVAAAAFLAAGLTMYSGFGLGTLLLPVFSLFFPVEIAVVSTALVHGANNVFKVALLGRHADWAVVVQFGAPAIVAAMFGAAMLGWISRFDIGLGYELAGRSAEITPVKSLIGFLMLGFALFELLPRFRAIQFERRFLPLGGALSGFFGGLSGHQGALRSAFLAKSGLSTEQFVGSNAVIGFAVDLTRIVFYAFFLSVASERFGAFDAWPMVAAGSVAAFAGVLVGRRLLHKVTMQGVQVLVGTLLFLVAIGLIAGLI
jgi:uncharacterized membrane protein YfcA